MKGRRLRPEEVDLWHKVNEKTEVMAQPSPLPDPIPVTVPMSRPRAEFKTVARPERPGGPSTRVDLAPTLTEAFTKQSLAMDRKRFTQLKRGNLKPEGKLDLHGMTVDRAHLALTRFVLNAQGSGKRLILVVTGKGKMRDDGGPIPVRFGVLRHQVPQWLSLPPLGSAVLQVTPAHQKHGGTGAYYVYLRKAR
ncbi:MAG: Smr/MutS family protein [Pseudomonadota bacterium]